MEGTEDVEEHWEDEQSPKEKKRKSTAADNDDQISEQLDNGSGSVKDGARLTKKKRNEEADEIFAESQRLLRESKGTAFVAQLPLQKPVSSVLEKIRQRKLQLAQRCKTVATGSLSAQCSSKAPTFELKNCFDGERVVDLDGDNEIEVAMVKAPTERLLSVKQEVGEPSTSGRHQILQPTTPSVAIDEIAEPISSRPSTPETHSEVGRSPSNSKAKIPMKSDNMLRQPLIESQDLYSDSQLSPLREESPVRRGGDDPVPVQAMRINLHLDSETQEDDLSRWSEEDAEKENKDPITGSVPDVLHPVSHIRGLIDDEAEDEDEDLLDDDDDDDEDAAEDLCDLLTQDVAEKPVDNERRASLHRKWLEQQDSAMTENILHRMEGGWKGKSKKERLPGFLHEAEDSKSGGSYSKSLNEGYDKLEETRRNDCMDPFDDVHEHGKEKHGLKRARSPEIDAQPQTSNMDMEDTNSHSVSDDEEADEKLRRQLLLDESEEHLEFLSVADDETSREIFHLINKVNIATIKPSTRSIPGYNEVRSSSSTHHQASVDVQSSFLRHKGTSIVQATTKQGSGNSRSYVFGRDDSNSNHLNRSEGTQEDKSGKHKASAIEIDDQTRNVKNQSVVRVGASGAKVAKTKEALSTEPSLFQILRQQAADLERSIHGNNSSFTSNGSNSRMDDLSIFSAMRPSKQSRSSRRT